MHHRNIRFVLSLLCCLGLSGFLLAQSSEDKKEEKSEIQLVAHLISLERIRTWQQNYEKYNIGCAAMSGDFAGIRFSPHIYNTMEEIDKVLAALAQLV